MKYDPAIELDEDTLHIDEDTSFDNNFFKSSKSDDPNLKSADLS